MSLCLSVSLFCIGKEREATLGTRGRIEAMSEKLVAISSRIIRPFCTKDTLAFAGGKRDRSVRLC